MSITLTYNAVQAQHKGYLGYKPAVRGHLYDNLFYRSLGGALKAARHMALVEANTLRSNGHAVVVKNERDLPSIERN